MVLWSNCALLLTIQFASLVFFFFFSFFPPRFCPGHIFGTVYSQRLQIECAAWSCGLIFALLLTIQFASLISSLINIISLLLTTLEFFIFGGSLLGRIQGDREPVSFFYLVPSCRLCCCASLSGSFFLGFTLLRSFLCPQPSSLRIR